MRYIIISFFIFIFSFSGVLAYDFFEDSGLKEIAEPAGYNTDVQEDVLEVTLARNITLVLSLVGVLFMILIIYGGISWMTAQGNEERVGKAKKIIIDSLIGLIIVVVAYAITYFILAQILSTGLIQVYNI